MYIDQLHIHITSLACRTSIILYPFVTTFVDTGCEELIKRLTRQYQTQRVTWHKTMDTKIYYFSVGVLFSDFIMGSSLLELGLYEGVTLRLRDFVEPERGGRATRRGRAVIWNSSEKASCITLVSVFSSRDSAKLPNSGILEHMTTAYLKYKSENARHLKYL